MREAVVTRAHRVPGWRWGVTDAELARHFPCDDLVPSPVLELWRGISVTVPPPAVWPWLRQVRLAPYSYDWLDNLGRRSPRELRDLPDPRPGDPFSCIGGRYDVGRVLAVVPGESLTATVMAAGMSYVLEPEGAGTRLLLKIVAENDRWYLPALAVGDWPMARRQLGVLKRQAEADRSATR